MMRHPLDADAIAADAHYDQPEIGTEEGDTCNRWQEPDEDCPKPWQCKGVMVDDDPQWPGVACDACGECV